MSFTKTSDTAYFMFGRFNPVTIGHGAIFEKLADDAHGHADAYVFVSSNKKQNSKNPLTVEEKMEYINKLYSERFHGRIQFINSGPHACNCNSALSAAKKLREKGYKTLVMYVGSDHEEGKGEDFTWVSKANEKYLHETHTNGTPLTIRNRIMPERTKSGNIRIMSPEDMSASKIRQIAHNSELPYSEKIDLVSQGTGLKRKDAIQLIEQISTYPDDAAKKRSIKSRRLSPNKLRNEFEHISLKNQQRSRSPKRSRSRSPRKGGHQTRKSKNNR
jgi:hypothetical protein